MSDANAIVGLVGVGSLVVGALVARLPVGTCSECPHCRAEAARAADEERRARSEYVRRRAAHPPRFPGPPSDDDDTTSDDGTWGRGHRS